MTHKKRKGEALIFLLIRFNGRKFHEMFTFYTKRNILVRISIVNTNKNLVKGKNKLTYDFDVCGSTTVSHQTFARLVTVAMEVVAVEPSFSWYSSLLVDLKAKLNY